MLFEIFERIQLGKDDPEKVWCWRAVTPENGETLATNTKGYDLKADAIRDVKRVITAGADPNTRILFIGDNSRVEVSLATAQSMLQSLE